MPEFFVRCDCRAPTATHCQSGDKAHASLAIHPTHGLAILTCYHGAACMAARCRCTIPHTAYIDGSHEQLAVIDDDESRDVAWLSASISKGIGARVIAATRPTVGDSVTVVLPAGSRTATVLSLPNRNSNPSEAVELELDCVFVGGDSGSPVLNASGEIVAVVRNRAGRCGFVVV